MVDTIDTQAVNQEQSTILFVDDEENILKSLRRLFMDDEYEVYTASSGEEGLKILRQSGGVGLIVSDQRMPGMTGVEFLKKSQEVSPKSIRILLTGYSDINAAMDAINIGGAYRYITKPWNEEELKQAVKNALATYYLVRENERLNEVIIQKNKELKKWSEELEVIVQEQTMELQKSFDSLREANSRQRTNFKSTIVALSGLLELRDRRMQNHSKNVAEISSRIATALEMPSEERETLMVAALLHDIGKIGTPDVMLQKDVDSFSAEEMKEYVKHPVRGQSAIDSFVDLRSAGAIIRLHHERFDGEGFPDRLKQNAIPLAARIIAVVDFVDKQMRKYKGMSGLDQILKAVRVQSGKSFDPKLIPLAEEECKRYYKSRMPKSDFTEVELFPRDLEEGMIISRDVHSGTGVLLLSRGTKLTPANISILKRYYGLDPSGKGVFVMVKD